MSITHIGNYLNIRGSASIAKGKNTVVVKVPLEEFKDYNLLDITIHLTPYISTEEAYDVDIISRIYTASKLKNNEFLVYGDEGSFYWMVQAVANDKYDFYPYGAF